MERRAVLLLVSWLGFGCANPSEDAEPGTGSWGTSSGQTTSASAGATADSSGAVGIGTSSTGADATATTDDGDGSDTSGGSSSTGTSACLDASGPVVRYGLAGVTGGIPSALRVVATVSTSDNLQAEIDAVEAAGGGVIVLTDGTHELSSVIQLRSNVVLRGESRAGTILESSVRGTEDEPIDLVNFASGVSGAGLEEITLRYRVDGCEPVDNISLTEAQLLAGPSGNDSAYYTDNPCGNQGLSDQLYVNWVRINNDANDNWLRAVSVLESGSHPVRIFGDHNEVRDCLIDRAYQKRNGPGGAAYFGVFGQDNLVIGNEITRIRHVLVSEFSGSDNFPGQYNVFYGNVFDVDMNFHDGGLGNNLVERNEIRPTAYKQLAGRPFLTGSFTNGHLLPGPDERLYKNDTSEAAVTEFNEQDVIYTFDIDIGAELDATDYQRVIDSGAPEPACETFYLPGLER